MSAEWSRPLLQRRDLGPMLHDFGHQVYGEAERRVLANGIGREPVDTIDLAMFAERSVDVVLKAMWHVGAQTDVEPIDEMIRHYHNFRKNKIGGFDSLTHGSDFSAVAKEGLRTGVVAPLQLFRTVKVVEEFLQEGRGGLSRPIRINATEAAERIASDEFELMLHQLGAMSNGALGSTSTQPDCLDMVGKEEVRTFSDMQHFGVVSSFAHDGANNVTGLSQEFLNYQKARKIQLRDSGARLGDTGGCPVRRATFPVLGDYAQPYFEALGTPDAQPRFQGDSLISRGSRFVCAALRVSIEGVAE